MQGAVNRPEERGPGLVVEDDHNAGGRQRRAAREFSFSAPERGKPPTAHTKREKKLRVKDISD